MLFKYLKRNILVAATVFWINLEGIRLCETARHQRIEILYDFTYHGNTDKFIETEGKVSVRLGGDCL